MWSWIIHVVGILGSCASVLLFLSSIGTIQQFKKLNSTASTPIFPFVMMYLNCACWTKYGLLIGEWDIMGTNMIGLMLSLYYMYNYDRFTKNHSSSRIQICLVLLFLYGLLVILRYLPPRDVINALGLVSSVFSVLMFGAPLITVWQVYRTRDSSSMSPRLCLMNFTCSMCWTIYGYLSHDKFIIVPNTLGIALSSVQLFLIRRYPAHEPKSMGVEVEAVIKDSEKA
jgi:solute carrier family 50 (sugar transporter)